MTELLRAAVIGGGVGGYLSMNGLAASEHYQLVAACDLRPEVCKRIEADFLGIKAFTSSEALLAEMNIDVICVSTFPPSHLPMCLDALKLPLKGLLMEKPLADTYAAGLEIMNAIKAKNLPVVVPHGLHQKPHAQEILKLVHGGAIGDLELVEIEFGQWDIINAGIHWYNFFVLLTDNDPLDFVMGSCDTSTQTYRDGMQVETMAITYAQTKSGIRLVGQSGDEVAVKGYDNTDKVIFRVIGSEGMIHFWGWENSYKLFNAEYPAGKLFEPTPFDGEPHQLHLDHLANMIASGEPNYAPAESSLMALELCEAAYVSHRNRCLVRMPLNEFKAPEVDAWDPGIPYAASMGGRNGREL